MNVEPLNFSQPKNKLSEVADRERAKLFPKNDYSSKNEYSSVNKDALADGDLKGKGTGGFLDTGNQNAGSIKDVIERKDEIKINQYQFNKPYTTPTA